MPETKPRILLHVCCGPCATAVYERLLPEYETTLYWYNPNIEPAEEYALRLESALKLAAELGLEMPVEEGGQDEFLTLTKGLEQEPEGGERCLRCYEMRLRRAMLCARKRAITQVTTTLSISPHKSAAAINAVGERLATEFGLHWLAADFKAGGGFSRSVELSKQYGLYRQKYCGCRYSQRA